MFSRSQIRKNKDYFGDTIDVTGIEVNLDIHQVEVTAVTLGETLTGGSIAFFAKGFTSNSEWQPIQKDGADYIMDLDASGVRSFDIPNSSISAVRGVPQGEGLSASGGTEWQMTIISGRKG